MLTRRAVVWALVDVTALLFAGSLGRTLSPIADAEGLDAVPVGISGSSPDGLGTWTVRYQHVAGGDPALSAALNDLIDAKAMDEVQRATWDASTRRPWTYAADGTASVGPITLAEVFTGQYDTAEPNMPMQSVSSVVCDLRSGLAITWDDLFVDKRAGLTRLGDETAAALSAVAPADQVRNWRRQGFFAPVEINFKAWKPTAAGIDLHFPEFQFGRGLKVVTVPWPNLADLIKPEFRAVMG